MKKPKETLHFLKLFRHDLTKCLANSSVEQWKIVYKEQIHILELVEKYIEDKKERK